MDMGRTTSLGRCTQTIEICILLVNDDLICHNIVMDMLQNCNHEAYDCERAMDALNVIKGRTEKLELVITNVERTDANKLGIIEHIEKEFKLRVALMRPDGNRKVLSRGTENGATVYIVKCSSLTDIKNLWENALARERGKMEAKEVDGRQRESFLEISSDSGVSERTRVRQKFKRNENGETSEQNTDSKDDSKAEKKARIQWNDEMHRKFLEAIVQLGHERAFPKKIVEVMNIPGLTREHVASHLQKHRMNLKKNQESLIGSFYGRTSINDYDLKEPCFPSSHSAPLTFGLQRGSKSTLPVPVPVPSSYRSYFNPELSTSKSRFGPGQSFSVNNQGKLHFAYNKQNFRVYGDQTKSVLLNVENTNNSGFVGLRLADDGKSVEIGQMSSLCRFGINAELRSCPSGIHGIKKSFQYPSTGNFEQYPSPSLPPLETNGNENVSQLLSLPVSFSPDQQSLPPLGGYNGNENLDLYPFSSLPQLISDVEKIPEQSPPPLRGYNGNEILNLYPFNSIPSLMSDVEENPEQSLPPLGGYNVNENLKLYPFSSLPPLITDVEENLDHCPLLPVDFSPLQQCSLNGVENCDDYLLQQYSPTQFKTFGKFNSDIEHLTFVDSTTTLNPPFEQPSISVPGEEGSMPPLQLDELDCFAVSEDIDVLVGNNSRSFSVDEFANILFGQKD